MVWQRRSIELHLNIIHFGSFTLFFDMSFDEVLKICNMVDIIRYRCILPNNSKGV